MRQQYRMSPPCNSSLHKRYCVSQKWQSYPYTRSALQPQGRHLLRQTLETEDQPRRELSIKALEPGRGRPMFARIAAACRCVDRVAG